MCLTLMLSFFVVGLGDVHAQDKTRKEMFNPACPETCVGGDVNFARSEVGEKRYIRLQMSIPGITKTCMYDTKVIDQGHLVDKQKPCHYVESSLPSFIKKVYNFSMGLIAIIAVIVIMIAGLQWVTAAGDPGKISGAKGKIKSAIIGVVLILSSYVILNLINPDLVVLQLNKPSEIDTVENVQSNWCDNIPKEIIRGKETIFTPDNKNYWDLETLKCGEKYNYGYISNNSFVEMGECDGNSNCKNGTMCAQVGVAKYCLDAEKFCKKYDKDKCEDANTIIRDANGGYGCTFRKDKFIFDWVDPDECVYGETLICDSDKNQTQVDCSQCSSGEKECRNFLGVSGVHSVCCSSTANLPNPYLNVSQTCVSKKIEKCENYTSEFECALDRCDVIGDINKKCVWQNDKCNES